MEYKWNGSSSPGFHCTHCPKPINAVCELSCQKEYQKLQDERKADGCIVREICDNRPTWGSE